MNEPPALNPPLWLYTSIGDLSFPLIFLANAFSALLLNLAVLLTIGRLSALTLNVGGVIKDWMLIAVSSWMFAAPMTALQLQGYGLAFLVRRRHAHSTRLSPIRSFVRSFLP